jgi:hypothetical protein
LEDQIYGLCRHVLASDGKKAFSALMVRQTLQSLAPTGESKDDESSKSDSILPACAVDRTADTNTGPLTVQVLKLLAKQEGLQLIDVAGQILWSFQSSISLQTSSFQKIAGDFFWIDLVAESNLGLELGLLKPNALVEGAYTKHMNSAGRIDQRTFLKVMTRSLRSYIVEQDGITLYEGSRCSCRQTDLYQLYAAQASKAGARNLDLHGFKQVLVRLAQMIDVHPCSVFVSVGESPQ